MVDQIGEFRAIGGRSARIDREHGIARRRIELVVGREMRAVGGERPAMDFEDQRVTRWPCDIVGRQGHPGIDRALVDRGGDCDVADLAEPLVVEQLGVEPGQLPPRAAADQHDVGRPGRAAAGERDRAVARDAEAAAGIGPVEIGAGSALRRPCGPRRRGRPAPPSSRHDRHIGRRASGRPRPRPGRSRCGRAMRSARAGSSRRRSSRRGWLFS